MSDPDFTPADATDQEPAAPRDTAMEGDARAPEASGDVSNLLQTLRKERDENYERYLRAVADLENYRRRAMREKDELRQFAISGLVESLLPVFENLGLAVASARQASDPEVIAKGVELVLDQFRGALSACGVTEIAPAVGSDFDPHQEESLAHAPSDTVPEEKILQVVRTGFMLNGRVLRPASVVLSSGPARDESAPGG